MVMAMAATAAAREAEGKKEDRAAQVASHQTRFQKIVLSWDYPRLLARSKVRSVIYYGEFAHFIKGVVGRGSSRSLLCGRRKFVGFPYPFDLLLAASLNLEQINHKKQKGADQYKLHKVPDSFADLNEYLKVFESLLLEECRAQILRGDDDGLYLSILHGALVVLSIAKSSYLLVFLVSIGSGH
jgi:hypothetical protein